MKNIVKVSTLLSLSAVTLLASGYRIPEQSLNATALSAAYVAGANGADANYYNPANMVFMGGGAEIQTSMTYINLPKVDYTAAVAGTPAGNANGDSKEEHFLIPTMHYVSPMMGDWRYGLSIVAPAGLSKRWDEAYQMRTSEEFTLQVVEINPTASYKVNDQFALGFGLRGIYTTGVIKVSGTGFDNEMEADSIDFGYNLAMSYKPMNDLTLSATYRSKIDLTVEGDAVTTLGVTPRNGKVSTQIPLPASLALAAAYNMDKTTVELVFERTYWSAYEALDFQFENAVVEASSLGASKAKNWKDVNAYRLGISHQYSETLKLMAGFAIDETPAPNHTLGFELPDSDAKLYSVGFEYKINQNTKVGLAYLYSDKEERTVSNTAANSANGTFSDGGAHLVTASLKYKF